MTSDWFLQQTLALALAALVALTGQSRPARPAQMAATPGPDACGANPGPPRDPRDPAIVVAAPAAGAAVSSPLAVMGQARVFEAVVSIALLGPNGDLASGRNVIVRTTAQAAAGAPASAHFSVSVPFSVSAPTDACLLVYEASARDGSPQNVVQTPLRLQPGRSR